MRSDLALQTYGADSSGMVCGFRFSPTLAGRPIDADEVIDWFRERGDDADAKDTSEFLWLHFNLAHSASERWMRTQLDLPDTFFDALREGSHSTRIEHADGALRAVVNDVMFNLEFIPSEIATLWICATRRLIVTARLKPLRSVDRLRASVRQGEVFRSPAELLVHLMRDQADLLVQIVRRTSADVDRIEDRFLSQRPTQNRLDLGAMRRTLTRLQRMLAPEPGAIFRLLARPPRWLHVEDVQDLRESTEEFSVVLSDVAGLIERVRLLQEEITSRLEEQNNRTLFTLTLVTVLAMPINIVAGFFGMNVGGIPLAENKHGFWVMVLLVAGFTGLTGWWAFRRRRER
ncbi:zinc transporter [Paraburkholderia atlantica]|uniref:transporter n=1 Tax=Paraburkholderia atlantica TaxID=2654982 RepID=UPI00128CFC75|nr:transporter [Paraburkholderia atlantica]MBB5421367.1 zinc transporter [Paraburkholderia atlantica]MPW11005.1 magnesium transporter CorA [Paraburkholderia atlantica]